jgi:hypothetical protein
MVKQGHQDTFGSPRYHYSFMRLKPDEAQGDLDKVLREAQPHSGRRLIARRGECRARVDTSTFVWLLIEPTWDVVFVVHPSAQIVNKYLGKELQLSNKLKKRYGHSLDLVYLGVGEAQAQGTD